MQAEEPELLPTSSELDCCEYMERGVFHDFHDRATGDDDTEEDRPADWHFIYWDVDED